jgi:hypothetical protein
MGTWRPIRTAPVCSCPGQRPRAATPPSWSLNAARNSPPPGTISSSRAGTKNRVITAHRPRHGRDPRHLGTPNRRADAASAWASGATGRANPMGPSAFCARVCAAFGASSGCQPPRSAASDPQGSEVGLASAVPENPQHRCAADRWPEPDAPHSWPGPLARSARSSVWRRRFRPACNLNRRPAAGVRLFPARRHHYRKSTTTSRSTSTRTRTTPVPSRRRSGASTGTSA